MEPNTPAKPAVHSSQINNPNPSSTNYALRPTQYLALFLCLFALYLLTYTPRINSSDGLAMFSTAESLARRGALDIEQIRWMDLQQGTYSLDGLLYSRKGIGVPLGLLPLTWLGLVLPWFGPVGLSLLFNAIVTALTAALLAAYLSELDFQPQTGFIVALTFGLTTLAWPYAKSLFSDPFSGLLLLAAAYFLLKMSRGEEISEGAGEQGSGGVEGQGSGGEKIISPAGNPTIIIRLWGLRYATLAGLCLGWNVATRYAEALFLPVFGLLFLYYLYRDYAEQQSRVPIISSLSRITHHASRFTFYVLRAPRLTLIAFLTPILLIGLALVAFNISRYGDPLNTGYLPNETFSGIWWQGILGQLVSPGRGLLLFCPIFILSLGGFFPFIRRRPAEALTALSIILIHLLLYGKWFMWHGGYAWGPRFMIPTLPFWAIFLAPIAAKAFPTSRPLNLPASQSPREAPNHPSPSAPLLPCSPAPLLLRLTFVTLALLGLIPQLLGVSIHFSPFLDSLLDTGLPLFAPETFFELQYSPFVAAWAFMQPDALDLVWAWQGQLNGWLLITLLVNIAINGFYLYGKWPSADNEPSTAAIQSSRVSTPFHFLPYLSMAAALIFLLARVHSLPPEPLQQAAMVLNEAAHPDDAIITNDPDMAAPLAELYKGRAPVLGLHHGGSLPAETQHRLEQTIAAHQQIWWLPNWLPPDQSAIEQTLLANGFRAREEHFGEQRLLLFAFPDQLTERLKVGAIFGERIALDEIAYPVPAAGRALPVELQWRGLQPITEDYHVFIHLVDTAGQLVAQADGQPVQWSRPTSTWVVNERIVDRHGLWLPPNTTPGAYQLSLGFYRPVDGRRLHLSNGRDVIEFQIIIQHP